MLAPASLECYAYPYRQIAVSGYGVCLLTLDSLGLCAAYTSLPPSNEKTMHTHSPARGLCELHTGWGLLEPLIHSLAIWGYCDDGRELN